MRWRSVQVGCNYKLNELDVKQLISGPIYNRYLELSNAHFVAVNPQLRWYVCVPRLNHITRTQNQHSLFAFILNESLG